MIDIMSAEEFDKAMHMLLFIRRSSMYNNLCRKDLENLHGVIYDDHHHHRHNHQY